MRTVTTRWIPVWAIFMLSALLVACGDSARRDNRDASASAAQLGSNTPHNTTTVNVVATDFTFTLDTSQINAGSVTFGVKNEGTMPHDFAIEGNGVSRKTRMLQPGQAASLTVELKPGVYSYVCTIPGHAMLGMKGTLKVN